MDRCLALRALVHRLCASDNLAETLHADELKLEVNHVVASLAAADVDAIGRRPLSLTRLFSARGAHSLPLLQDDCWLWWRSTGRVACCCWPGSAQ